MPTIKAHFDGKVIVPDQPVELKQGQALTVHFEPASDQVPPADSSQHFLDWVVQNLVAKTDRPTDAGVRHDHYLHRTRGKMV